MTPSRTPPRFARWLLVRALPPDVREDVSGDLEEMFRRRHGADGHSRAWCWYWRQTAAFILRFSCERLRERVRHVDMSTGISWIDLRLALRMLVRYPGLTLVGVLGMAVAITISAAAFVIGQNLLDPDVRLPEGDRLVSVVSWNAQTNNREHRTLHDFIRWREQLTTLEEVGAFRTIDRNLVAPGAQPETVTVAEITASGFHAARTPAALGRHLVPSDELAGAPDVVVLGDDAWRRRFDADPGILGSRIQLGATSRTVVGVMPPGFMFPVDHSYWVPLRIPKTAEPLTGSRLAVFGRLAPGATIDEAGTQLEAIGRRAAVESPYSHEHVRPRVVPYTHAFTDMDDPGNALALRATQTLIVLLLVLIAVNVAILVYARTATREGEIAVRSALGASRRRIVGQLFLEALVLAGVAAIAGIGLLAFALRHADAALARLAPGLPFWISLELTPGGVAWIALLTVFAATIVGILPALKATGRRVQSRLQGLSTGGGARMQMGPMWTSLIVAQVAFAVAILPATTYHAWDSLRSRTPTRGSVVHELITAQLVMDRASDLEPVTASEREFTTRYAGRLADLEQRLEAEASIAAVTFSQAGPGGELAAVLEVEGGALPDKPADYNIVEGSRQGHLVRFNRVALDFFETFDVPLLIGRAPGAGDAESVLVNRAFVDRMLAGENALGRRVRYVGRSREAAAGTVSLGRWYEIVGVIEDFPATTRRDGAHARVYHAASPGDVHPVEVSVRVRGAAPSTLAPRFREIAAAVDPALQVRNLSTVEDVLRREQGILRVIGFTLAAVTLSVVLLSAAGIYALMSFTVARRRREIGIRAALGAEPTRILVGIFSRAFVQLGAGAAFGVLGAIGVESLLEGDAYQGQGAIVVPMVAVLTMIVGLLSAVGPARQGLSIQPIDALREE